LFSQHDLCNSTLCAVPGHTSHATRCYFLFLLLLLLLLLLLQ
jgi:hypothetical protein